MGLVCVTPYSLKGSRFYNPCVTDRHNINIYYRATDSLRESRRNNETESIPISSANSTIELKTKSLIKPFIKKLIININKLTKTNHQINHRKV